MALDDNDHPMPSQEEFDRPLAEGETLRSLDWIAIVVRPLMVSAMMACVVAGVVVWVEATIPTWQGTYVVVMVAVMAFITVVTEQRLRHFLDASERTAVRIAEFLLLLVSLRLMMYTGRGWNAFSRDLRIWLGNPGTLIFDPEYMLLVGPLLGLRVIAANIATALLELEVTEETRVVHRGRWETLQPGFLKSPLAYLYDRFVRGALVLLAAVGLLQIDLSGQFIHLRPAQMGPLTWLPLAYVGLGLLLLGQARYALLVAHWQREGIPVASEVRQRWASWGVLFVFGVSLAALFLPAYGTGTGVYLLLWLSFLLALVGQVLMFLVHLLLYPIAWLLSNLTSQQAEQAPLQPVAPPQPTPPPPPPSSEFNVPTWFTRLQLTVFWVAAATVLLLVLRRYLRYQQATGQWGDVLRSIRQWLVRVWRGLLGQWRGIYRRMGASSLAQMEKPEPEEERASPRWRRLWQATTARERVRRLYSLMLRHAANVGHPRSPTQTPYEYATLLRPHVIEEQEALEGLTQAFVEARYSKRDFEDQEITMLRRLLARLRKALAQP